MRPVVKPALRRLWRDHTTLQLGVSPACARVLTGLDASATALLRRLDGSLTRADAERVASKGGESSLALLAALDAAGAIDDHVTARRGDPLVAERGALSLRHLEPGAADRVLAVRAAARVAVEGTGPVAAAVSATLRSAGVGTVTEPVVELGGRGLETTTTMRQQPRTRRPQLVVLCPDATGEPARALGVRLHALGVAHLPAYVCETTGVIGPLVLPGRSCCLHCVFLHRCDRDPGWPVVASQLMAPNHPDAVDACPSALAAAVAALAALQALQLIDAEGTFGAGDTPATIGATLEVPECGWPVRRRRWPVHPECACA